MSVSSMYFLCGLFHDLPEVLTRDIISPIKRSIQGLDDLIKDIEKRQVAEKLLPLLPHSWHEDILYFTEDEFSNRAVVDGEKITCRPEEIRLKYNENGKGYRAVDGTVLKCCDHLAAFVEAYLSIEYGISSKHLRNGMEDLREQYKNKVRLRFGFWEALRGISSFVMWKILKMHKFAESV